LDGDSHDSHIDELFRLKSSYQGLAVTATSQYVYVVARSIVGCIVVRYMLANRSIAERVLATKEQCAGIASDGTAIYVTLPQKNEIRYLSSWEASPRSWNISGAEDLGTITFDRVAHRIIAADYSGKAFAISTSDGAQQAMASNLGWVNSIAASPQHILVASGTKILSLARSDNHGENPPLSLQSLTGGHIVGVAIDSSDRAWFADFDKELAQGPLSID
jgi:hypothetical protein